MTRSTKASMSSLSRIRPRLCPLGAVSKKFSEKAYYKFNDSWPSQCRRCWGISVKVSTLMEWSSLGISVNLSTVYFTAIEAIHCNYIFRCCPRLFRSHLGSWHSHVKRTLLPTKRSVGLDWTYCCRLMRVDISWLHLGHEVPNEPLMARRYRFQGPGITFAFSFSWHSLILLL